MFGNIIRHVLSKKTTCIDRMEYWFMIIIGVIITLFIEAITFIIWQTWFASYMNIALLVFVIEAILFLIYGCYIGIKRFRDAGRTVAYFWICFVLQFVLVGIVMMLLVLCSPGNCQNE